MKIVVLKFGGTSVGTIEKFKKVADIICVYLKKKYKVIVVSSAMSGVTNELINKSKKISGNFSEEEYDVLVSSGEQIACSLLAGRLIHKGYKSRSWLSWQVPIITVGSHKNSRINQINKKNVTLTLLLIAKKNYIKEMNDIRIFKRLSSYRIVFNYCANFKYRLYSLKLFIFTKKTRSRKTLCL